MVLAGRDVMREPLTVRRELLETKVLPKLVGAGSLRGAARREPPGPDPVREGAGLRGAGRQASRQPLRAGPAIRRVDEDARQPGAGVRDRRLHRRRNPFDALIFGYYEGDRLMYAARTRNGFTPAVRAQLFKKFRALEIKTCPFANLPEPKGGRWGAGLDGGEDGGLPLAEAGARRPVRVRRMDAGQSPAAHEVRRAARGQGCAGGPTRVGTSVQGDGVAHRRVVG